MKISLHPQPAPIPASMIRRRARECFSPQLHRAHSRPYPPDAPEQIAQRYVPFKDPYQLARELQQADPAGWAGMDMSILEALDVLVDGLDQEALFRRCQWVRKYQIQPAFGVGTQIAQGRIVGIQYGFARYEVETLAPNRANTRPAICYVNYEDADSLDMAISPM